jgi:hypothetical protein
MYDVIEQTLITRVCQLQKYRCNYQMHGCTKITFGLLLYDTYFGWGLEVMFCLTVWLTPIIKTGVFKTVTFYIWMNLLSYIYFVRTWHELNQNALINFMNILCIKTISVFFNEEINQIAEVLQRIALSCERIMCQQMQFNSITFMSWVI